MSILKIARCFLIVTVLFATADAAQGQLALPFTAKTVADGGGVEVVNSTDPQLQSGDVITFVAQFGGAREKVISSDDLLAKAVERKSQANSVAVWRLRANNGVWVTLTLIAAANESPPVPAIKPVEVAAQPAPVAANANLWSITMIGLPSGYDAINMNTSNGDTWLLVDDNKWVYLTEQANNAPSKAEAGTYQITAHYAPKIDKWYAIRQKVTTGESWYLDGDGWLLIVNKR